MTKPDREVDAILLVSLIILAGLLIAGWTYLGYHVISAGLAVCSGGVCR